MGERHQIYLVYSEKTAYNLKEDERGIIALHHQWLYGRTQVKMLYNYLNFLKELRRCDPDTDDEETGYGGMGFKYMTKQYLAESLKYNYSYIREWGYIYRTILEDFQNPLLGANNTGITIIDARDIDDIRYCFMGLRDNQEFMEGFEAYTPISVENYLKNYIDEDEDDEETDFDRKMYVFFSDYKVLSAGEIFDIFPELLEHLKERSKLNAQIS